MTKRRNFDAKSRRAMRERAKNDRGEICCEGCGLVLAGKKYEYDHTIPEALVPEWKKSEKLTEKDGQLLGKKCCHRGPDGKTDKDIAQIAKAKRQDEKQAGSPKKMKTRYRKKPKEQKRHKIDKDAIAAASIPGQSEIARRIK